MPKGGVKVERYILSYKNLKPGNEDVWIEHNIRYKCIEDIAKDINVSIPTAYNIKYNKAKTYNDFYKIEKIR